MSGGGAERSRLLVFVKAPRPGFVKTRLAQGVGPAESARIYERLATHLLRGLSPLPQVELHHAPADAGKEVRPWLLRPEWRALPQAEGELGHRLEAAFRQGFASGAAKLAVIGSDCPWVTPEDVEEAWRLLEGNDLVLGPAEDGGYWLIALKAPHPGLFDGIAWSTGEVLTQTMAKATELKLKCQLLRVLSDVDTVEDWQRVEHLLTQSKR